MRCRPICLFHSLGWLLYLPIPIFVMNKMDVKIMDTDTYENTMSTDDIRRRLEQGECSIEAGDIMDAFESLGEVRENHGL